MQLALTPSSAPPEARLMLRAGFTALRDIARSLRFPDDTDPDPRPQSSSPTWSSTRPSRCWRRRRVAERTAEQAWPHFHGWRV